MNTVILAIALLGVAIGVLYTLFKPRWAIVFIIILYPLEQLLTTLSPFFATNSKFLNLLIGGLAVVSAGSAVIGGRRPTRGYINLVMIATALLYLWAVTGIIWTPDKQKAIDDLIAGIPYLGLLLVFPALLINDLSDFRRLMYPTMVIGTAIIVLIITSPKTAMFGGRLGIEGAFGTENEIQNPLATATLGGTIAIIAVLVKPTEQVLFKNIIRGAALAAGLAIAMLSGSRGQLLGAVAVSFLMFPFARQIKNLKQFMIVSVSAGAAAVFAAVVLSLVTSADAAGRWSGETLESGLGVRWEMILEMMGVYFESPANILQGLGTSSFSTYWTKGDIPYVHNMPVQILTEHGLIGAAILCVLMLLCAKISLEMLRFHREDPAQLSMAAVLIGICLYQLILSLKQSNFYTSGVPFWWFLIMAKVHARDMLDATAHQVWAMEHDAFGEYGEHGDYGLSGTT